MRSPEEVAAGMAALAASAQENGASAAGVSSGVGLPPVPPGGSPPHVWEHYRQSLPETHRNRSDARAQANQALLDIPEESRRERAQRLAESDYEHTFVRWTSILPTMDEEVDQQLLAEAWMSEVAGQAAQVADIANDLKDEAAARIARYNEADHYQAGKSYGIRLQSWKDRERIRQQQIEEDGYAHTGHEERPEPPSDEEAYGGLGQVAYGSDPRLQEAIQALNQLIVSQPTTGAGTEQFRGKMDIYSGDVLQFVSDLQDVEQQEKARHQRNWAIGQAAGMDIARDSGPPARSSGSGTALGDAPQPALARDEDGRWMLDGRRIQRTSSSGGEVTYFFEDGGVEKFHHTGRHDDRGSIVDFTGGTVVKPVEGQESIAESYRAISLDPEAAGEWAGAQRQQVADLVPEDRQAEFNQLIDNVLASRNRKELDSAQAALDEGWTTWETTENDRLGGVWGDLTGGDVSLDDLSERDRAALEVPYTEWQAENTRLQGVWTQVAAGEVQFDALPEADRTALQPTYDRWSWMREGDALLEGWDGSSDIAATPEYQAWISSAPGDESNIIDSRGQYITQRMADNAAHQDFVTRLNALQPETGQESLAQSPAFRSLMGEMRASGLYTEESLAEVEADAAQISGLPTISNVAATTEGREGLDTGPGYTMTEGPSFADLSHREMLHSLGIFEGDPQVRYVQREGDRTQEYLDALDSGPVPHTSADFDEAGDYSGGSSAQLRVIDSVNLGVMPDPTLVQLSGLDPASVAAAVDRVQRSHGGGLGDTATGRNTAIFRAVTGEEPSGNRAVDQARFAEALGQQQTAEGTDGYGSLDDHTTRQPAMFKAETGVDDPFLGTADEYTTGSETPPTPEAVRQPPLVDVRPRREDVQMMDDGIYRHPAEIGPLALSQQAPESEPDVSPEMTDTTERQPPLVDVRPRREDVQMMDDGIYRHPAEIGPLALSQQAPESEPEPGEPTDNYRQAMYTRHAATAGSAGFLWSPGGDGTVGAIDREAETRVRLADDIDTAIRRIGLEQIRGDAQDRIRSEGADAENADGVKYTDIVVATSQEINDINNQGLDPAAVQRAEEFTRAQGINLWIPVGGLSSHNAMVQAQHPSSPGGFRITDSELRGVNQGIYGDAVDSTLFASNFIAGPTIVGGVAKNVATGAYRNIGGRELVKRSVKSTGEELLLEDPAITLASVPAGGSPYPGFLDVAGSVGEGTAEGFADRRIFFRTAPAGSQTAAPTGVTPDIYSPQTSYRDYFDALDAGADLPYGYDPTTAYRYAPSVSAPGLLVAEPHPLAGISPTPPPYPYAPIVRRADTSPWRYNPGSVSPDVGGTYGNVEVVYFGGEGAADVAEPQLARSEGGLYLPVRATRVIDRGDEDELAPQLLPSPELAAGERVGMQVIPRPALAERLDLRYDPRIDTRIDPGETRLDTDLDVQLAPRVDTRLDQQFGTDLDTRIDPGETRLDTDLDVQLAPRVDTRLDQQFGTDLDTRIDPGETRHDSRFDMRLDTNADLATKLRRRSRPDDKAEGEREDVAAGSGLHPHEVVFYSLELNRANLLTGQVEEIPVNDLHQETLMVTQRGRTSTEGRSADAGGVEVVNEGGRVKAEGSTGKVTLNPKFRSSPPASGRSGKPASRATVKGAQKSGKGRKGQEEGGRATAKPGVMGDPNRFPSFPSSRRGRRRRDEEVEEFYQAPTTLTITLL